MVEQSTISTINNENKQPDGEIIIDLEAENLSYA